MHVIIQQRSHAHTVFPKEWSHEQARAASRQALPVHTEGSLAAHPSVLSERNCSLISGPCTCPSIAMAASSISTPLWYCSLSSFALFCSVVDASAFFCSSAATSSAFFSASARVSACSQCRIRHPSLGRPQSMTGRSFSCRWEPKLQEGPRAIRARLEQNRAPLHSDILPKQRDWLTTHVPPPGLASKVSPVSHHPAPRPVLQTDHNPSLYGSRAGALIERLTQAGLSRQQR